MPVTTLSATEALARLAGLLEDALPLLNEFGHLAHDHGYRTLAIEADAQRARGFDAGKHRALFTAGGEGEQKGEDKGGDEAAHGRGELEVAHLAVLEEAHEAA